MKRVVAKRTEIRCGICSSGNRGRFDAYLQLRANDKPDEGGRKITWPVLEELSGVLTGKRLDKRSLRRHLDGHVRIVDDARAAELEERAETGDAERDALIGEIDRLLESGETVSPSGLLALQMRSYLHSLREKLAAGESVALTHDQAQRAATAMFTNAKRAEEASLLSALTSGIEKSVRLQLGSVDAEPVAELEPGEVEVQGEVIAEEDVA